MAYTPQTWTDSPSTSTPISAARLTVMENGIAAASTSDDWLLRRTYLGSAAVPSRRTWWANKANTSSPSTTEDTLQTGIKYSAPTFPFIVSGGKLTTAATTGLNYVYRYFGESAPITRIGARFTFDASGGKTTGNGSCTMALMNDDLDNQGLTTFRLGAHFSVQATGWLIDKATNATGTAVFTNLITQPFAKMLAVDGTTVHTIELYRVGNTLTVLAPDGSVTSVTDSDIGTWCGNYGFHEVSVNNAATDVVPAYTETWSDVGTQYPPTDQFATGAMLDQHDLETKTLTNTRITARSSQVTNTTSWTIDADSYDYAANTGLTGAVTLNNPTGTPTAGQKLWVALTGTASRAISYGSAFESSTVTLPTTTASTARLDIGFVWNNVTNKWRCVGVS